MSVNRLYFGDNLEVLDEHVTDESVDLIYLDPPFNSNRNYSVIFGRNRAVDESAAQIQAFEDTWRWTHATEVLIGDLSNTAPQRVADALSAYYTLLGESEALAYLVNITPRLLQLYRVLKPTGTLFLHCDPTMSHYLKVLLDAVFDARNFQNEISWKRFSGKNDSKRFGRSHDVILFYSKSKSFKWNVQYGPFEDDYVDENYRFTDPDTGRRYRQGDLTAAKPGGDVSYEWHGARPYSGRFWAFSRENMDKMLEEGRIEFRSTGMPVYKRYLDEQPGVPLQDIWTDLRLHSGSKERLGYPTQKPVSLLERIITSTTDEGDVVLDPFCGCGTTVDAAQRLGRQWTGIDITHLAIDVITKRLLHTYGSDVFKSIALTGIPKDLGGARALFDRSPLEFERWAVSMMNAEPNQKQVGDKGIDGVARFPLGTGKIGKLLVSVKGGKTINPSMVRDLSGTVEARKAQMGVLITLAPATKGVTDAIDHGGVFTHPANGQKYPRLQHITVADLLAKKRPQVPPTFLPYIAAQKHTVTLEQTTLFATA